MEKKLAVYSKRKTRKLQEDQPSSCTESSSSSESNPKTVSEKRSKKRKKAKSDLHADNDSGKIWKDLSNMFAKSSEATCLESASVQLLKDKDKGSTFGRLSSFFKNQRSSSDAITPLTNIGVSPVGYQAAVSETKIQATEDKAIAMAVRLPTGTTVENVAVTIELEAANKGEESATDVSSADAMTMKCCEETESKTIFTGIIRVPPNTDVSKLANMPLYLVDSNEKLVLNPGSEISYRKLIKPSEYTLLSDDESQILVGDVRVKLRLDKIEKSTKNKKTKNMDRKRSIGKELISNESYDQSFRKRKTANEKATEAESESIVNESAYHAFKKEEENATVAEIVQVINESASQTPKDREKSTVSDMENVVIESAHQATNKSEKNATVLGLADSTCNKSERNTASLDPKRVLNRSLNNVECCSKEVPGKMCKECSLRRASDDGCCKEEQKRQSTNNSGSQKVGQSGKFTERYKIHHEGALQNFALVENPVEWLNAEYLSAPLMRTGRRDSSTQYSNTNLMANKEIDAQCSLILTNYGIFNEKYNRGCSSPTPSSRMFLPSSGYLTHNASQTVQSDESAETVGPKSTTSTATGCSSALLSDFSAYYNYNDLKVPSNSPSSCTEIQENDQKRIKCVQNDLDLSLHSKNVNKITLRYKKPEKSRTPVSYTHSNINSKPHQQQPKDHPFTASTHMVEKATITEASKFEGLFSPEEELCSTDFDFGSKRDLKFPLKNQKDKTLDLLEGARSKLEAYLRRNSHSSKASKVSNQNLEDVCGLLPMDHNLDGLCANRFTEMRNVDVSWNSPFDPCRYEKEEISRRCLEDDDQYYERQRSNIRRYFETEDCSLSIDHEEAKKNLNFYLNGNTEVNPGSPNTVFQVYPVIVDNTPKIKSLKGQCKTIPENTSATTSQSLQHQTIVLPPTSKTSNYELGSKKTASDACNKLERELNTLQQIYRDMCSSMKLILEHNDNASPCTLKAVKSQTKIKPRSIETISDDLTDTFNELKICLSTVDQILEESRSSLEEGVDATLPPTTQPLPTLSGLFYGLLPKVSQAKQTKSTNVLETVDTITSHILDSFTTVSDVDCLSTPKVSKDEQLKFSDFLEDVDTLIAPVLEPLATTDCVLCESRSKASRVKQAKSTDVLETIETIMLHDLEPNPSISNAICRQTTKEIQDKPSEFIGFLKDVDPVVTPILKPCTAVSGVAHEFPPKTKQAKETKFLNSTDTTTSHLLEQFRSISDRLCGSPTTANQMEKTESTDSLENFNTITPPLLKQVPTISDALCESPPKTGETIVENKSDVPSEDINQTYFAMEHEIKRTIQELLKESRDIREVVILNGGQEDAEPPFSFEYISALTEPDPLVICKKILEDIASSSGALFDTNEENKGGCNGPEEDVQYIMNVLLEEVNKTKNFIDDFELIKMKESERNLDVVNFIDTADEDPRKNRTDLQTGDANSEQNSSKSNDRNIDQFAYFCNTIAFHSKVPKTSFSFGETPSAYLEVPHSPCKTPVRRRDGLTITGEDGSFRDLETSRLFNELLSLQTDMSNYGKHSDIKIRREEDLSSEDEYSSAHDMASQEFATVSHIPDISILNEVGNKQSKEPLSSKQTHILEMTRHKNPSSTGLVENENSNNTENSDSDDDTPQHSPKSEGKSSHENATVQSHSTKIRKSQKHLQLTNSLNNDIAKNLPSTSTTAYRHSITTEEEELTRNVDLTQKQYDFSTEPEYFILTKASGFTENSSTSYSQAQVSRVYDSSSEEEIITPAIRKPRSKKKKDVTIVEIKPKTSLASDSDSIHFTQTRQPMVSSNQGLLPLNSHIVLKPAEATADIQNKLMSNHTEEPSNNDSTAATTRNNELVPREINISDVSFGSALNASDTEYEGDQEAFQVKLPNPRYRFKSTQELNTPEEIAKIEQNVKENDQLERRTKMVLIPEQSSQLDCENSTGSENYSRSELSVIESGESAEINAIDADNVRDASKLSLLPPPKIEPS